MQTIMEDGKWRVTCRINKSNNLTLEIEHDGDPHAEVILQEGGVIDLGTKARPWELGQKGWEMPHRQPRCASTASRQPTQSRHHRERRVVIAWCSYG
jgi:hypothetical protein